MKKFSNRKWLTIFLAIYGGFVFLPFMAPVFMHWNLLGIGRAIYLIYSFLCHQLPERSLFLFGPKLMYSMNEIRAVWQNTDNPFILRQFIGNPEMGWKVAWSDRMISLYGGIWVIGLIWGLLPRNTRKVSIWFFILFGLPMALDGLTHLISDFSGLANGFRYSNDWLVFLTRNSLPQSFYTGDGLGSFNSWMRWITGLLFGLGLVWWAFPLLDEQFGQENLAKD
ncbi:MAG: DUF2085 domain-containing protein [Anaerolineales bacterium]|nr:DUF2085 domain-containing protein [Anaerolineales bacterium]